MLYSLKIKYPKQASARLAQARFRVGFSRSKAGFAESSGSEMLSLALTWVPDNLLQSWRSVQGVRYCKLPLTAGEAPAPCWKSSRYGPHGWCANTPSPQTQSSDDETCTCGVGFWVQCNNLGRHRNHDRLILSNLQCLLDSGTHAPRKPRVPADDVILQLPRGWGCSPVHLGDHS